MTPAATESISTLSIERNVDISAPIDAAFRAVLEELGPGGVTPDGKSLNFKLEAWVGGRWYRDLGNNTGHWWATVQVYKPPTLLELAGPMFMSYPAVSHVQYRLTHERGATRLWLTHRAMGLIQADHREGVSTGWSHWLERIRVRAEASP